MSLCVPCTRLLPIDICCTSIIIGVVPQINTPYNIYFRSLANGFIVKYQATSSATGLLTLEPENGFILACGMLYEVWANTTNYSQCGDDLTICDTTAQCYQVEFERIKNDFTAEQITYNLTYNELYNVQEFKTTDCC